MARLYNCRNHLVLFNNSTLDSIDNIPNVVICHIRTGGEAHTNLEQCLAYTVDVCRGIFIHRLLVHGFPQRARLNLGLVHDNTQSLHVVVGFAVGMGILRSMDDTSGTTHSTCHDGLVGVLLSF